jgi:hypothetical protein
VVGVEGHAVPAEAAAAYHAFLERRPDRPISLKLDGQKAPASLTCRSDAQMPPIQHLLR